MPTSGFSLSPADPPAPATSDPAPPVSGAGDAELALPPRLARRARGLPWRLLLLEAFFTVAAILLALAADDWQQRRENRELAETALEEFRRELAANQRQLATVRPYHDSLRAALRRALADDSGSPIRSPTDVFPQFRGTRPAFLVDAAWETAVATGALRHMEPRVVRALSTAYALQADLDALNRSVYGVLLSPAVMDAEDFTLGARMVAIYLGDVTTVERELAEMYAGIFRRIGEPTPEAAPPPAPSGR